jgi:hypothetical protein
MRTTSIIFALLLVIPFGWTIASAISVYYVRMPFEHSPDLFILRGFAIGILYDLIVAIVAIVLITKKNYYASTIICGTVVFGFILYEVLNYASIFLFQWLKLV